MKIKLENLESLTRASSIANEIVNNSIEEMNSTSSSLTHSQLVDDNEKLKAEVKALQEVIIKLNMAIEELENNVDESYEEDDNDSTIIELKEPLPILIDKYNKENLKYLSPKTRYKICIALIDKCVLNSVSVPELWDSIVKKNGDM